MHKKLIINVDDFGLSKAVNYGILESYLQNSISSISMMVNLIHSKHASTLIKKYGIDIVGIHINLTLGKPVSSLDEIPSLVDENGNFHSSSWWQENKANEDELIIEFDRQIALFQSLNGFFPLHINYHHRYDFYKEYPKLAEHLFKYNVPMRLENDFLNYPYQYVANSTLFLGNQDANLADYLISECIELPCHIGYVDQDLIDMSSLNMDRLIDYNLVNSKEFKEAYQNLGYTLTRWRDIEKKNLK